MSEVKTKTDLPNLIRNSDGDPGIPRLVFSVALIQNPGDEIIVMLPSITPAENTNNLARDIIKFSFCGKNRTMSKVNNIAADSAIFELPDNKPVKKRGMK
jgi:hypothetical protein